jgi:hypothetical protein
MKSIKRISLILPIIATILFLIFGVEYNFGYKYPETKKCEFPKGQKKVYVHWIKLLNNTTSNFCDYSLTPMHYNNTEKHSCNCE